MTAPASENAPRIGRYRIVGELGRGGMGVVYRAVDDALGRPVAVKMLLAENDPTGTARARFRREAETIARLRHPGILGVHEWGEAGGRPYLAMDLVDGQTLEDALGAISLDAAVAVVRDAARAVHHAHGQGIIHRDLKPANVMLERVGGRALVMDFGIARVLDARTRLTKTGAMMGTPYYMPPEQLGGGEERSVDARSDVYALGGTLYHAIAERPPFSGAGADYNLFAAIISKMPDPPSRSRRDGEADAALDAVCLRAMAKDPGDRYPSAEAFAADLDRWLHGDPITASSPGAASRLGSGLRARAGPLAAAVLLAASAALGLAAVIGTGGGSANRAGEPDPTPPPLDRAADAAVDLVPARTWWEPAPEQLAFAEERGWPLWFESSVGIRFVLIPPGTFIAGSPLDEEEREEGELPPHEVTLEAFYASATEVTNGQLRRWRGDHDSGAFGGLETRSLDGDEQPAARVNLIVARSFARWLGREEGAGARYRLPTEAEWERAARAGRDGRWPWGEDRAAVTRHANVRDEASIDFFESDEGADLRPEFAGARDDGWRVTAPVGRFEPNRFGLYDVIGNVAEWTRDAVPGGSHHPVRGGSYRSWAHQNRLAARPTVNAGAHDPDVGFRLIATEPSDGVRRPPPPTPPPEIEPAPEQREAAEAASLPVVFDNEAGMRFVLIPAGDLVVGSDPDADPDHLPDETAHRVRISRPFHIAATELTHEQRRHLVPTHWANEPDAFPSIVTFHEASALVDSLNALEDRWRYRLPTEAEWEHAARAASAHRYFWGDDTAGGDSRANVESDGPRAVASLEPNPWGLFDVSGNLLEWCSDRYGVYPAGPVIDPAGSEVNDGDHRVIRGGAWDLPWTDARLARRREAGEGSREAGIRVVAVPRR